MLDILLLKIDSSGFLKGLLNPIHNKYIIIFKKTNYLSTIFKIDVEKYICIYFQTFQKFHIFMYNQNNTEWRKKN